MGGLRRLIVGASIGISVAYFSIDASSSENNYLLNSSESQQECPSCVCNCVLPETISVDLPAYVEKALSKRPELSSCELVEQAVSKLLTDEKEYAKLLQGFVEETFKDNCNSTCYQRKESIKESLKDKVKNSYQTAKSSLKNVVDKMDNSVEDW